MRNSKAKRFRKLAKVVTMANDLPQVGYYRTNDGQIRLVEKCMRSVYHKFKKERV